MTPEERSLLERTYKLVEENNNILRSIRRATRFSMAFRILYWVVIIVVSFGAYYFIQPYIETMLGAYEQVQGGLMGLQGNLDAAQTAASSLKDLLQ